MSGKDDVESIKFIGLKFSDVAYLNLLYNSNCAMCPNRERVSSNVLVCYVVNIENVSEDI
ncbi:hypothetical protein PanWU01x14_079440 [Parasponia andersonii]|uniref:Uncharacterized protein n=1 Tax=Parasponia andersonii TaxID=3476 RepID=A0A2P5DBE7_PARAD|nr:hypothetical protein PanWU01x14_079440 [Parasponia andersonii]